MDETALLDQAEAVASLMPALMRRLSAQDHNLADQLPLAQLRVCSILRDGPLSMSVLSRELHVSLSAMTQIADRLEGARLVKRVAEENDRRVRCLQLTGRGEKMMYERQQARVQRAQAVLKNLPPAARGEVRAALETLLRACETFAASEAARRHDGDSGVEFPAQPDLPSSAAGTIL